MSIAAIAVDPERPRVTVIVPVRNEAAFIARNLNAILAQDYPADRLEVIVADGRSDDTTLACAMRIAERVARERTGARVVVVDNPARIMAAGFNAALEQATGDVVVLVGGHAWLPPHYVRTCVDVLLASDADAVGGAIESVGDGPIGEAIAAAMGSSFGIGNSGFRTAQSGEPFEVETIAFAAYRRGVFEKIGVFHTEFMRHQLYEFNHRLRQSGGRILLIPELRAVYHVRDRLGALWTQAWQNGVWKGRFLRGHPQSIRIRHLVPSLFALAVLMCALGAVAFPPCIVVGAGLVGAYLGFLVVALLSFAAEGRWRVLPALPAVLACLHLGYGLGVWRGLTLPRIPLEPAPRDPA